MKELVFEPKKAKAQDRLKTDEEIIKEEKERLEKLEELRLMRMKGGKGKFFSKVKLSCVIFHYI